MMNQILTLQAPNDYAEIVGDKGKFIVGKTYQCRSTCDHDCIFRYVVISRTKTFLTIKNHSKTTKRKIYIDGTEEYCYPQGQYSMCPILRASSIAD
jgi:hypothetical protein